MKELNNNKGFTLIELLVIIVLLSLVMGVSFYAISSSIQKAKENTYKTTINNIESEANNYLLENSNRLFFISDDENGIEYQCITVRNLIDMGYFDSTITKSEIANDRKVKESDYIYIEKDLVSKTVKMQKLVMDTDSELIEKCAKVIGATRDIEFIIPDGYSREKEIIITYKLKNINDMDEYSNYSYLYSYPVNEIEGTVTSGNTVKIKVTENGELTGKIVYNGNNTSIEREYIESVNVTGIDNIGPVISLGSYTSGYVKGKVTIPLKVTDSGIGVDYNSFTKDDIIVTIDGNSVSNITLENKGSGNYNLIINNTEYSGKVIIDIEANKVLDKLDNGNETVILKPNITFDHIPPITYTDVGEHIFVAPGTGTYKLEVWGAGGGQGSNAVAGYGGYSIGSVQLTAGETLYINVGGVGALGSGSTGGAGGYNGGGKGGNGYASYGKEAGSGGGGATHIAKVSGELSTLESYKGTLYSDNSTYDSSYILIVAGGGGGGTHWTYNDGYSGGSGGGNSGVVGKLYSGTVSGGTQTAGASFGAGADGVRKGGTHSCGMEGSGGGGGGWYGGNTASKGTNTNGGGGGGSGYIGSSLLTNKYMFCYGCSESTSTNIYTVNTRGSSSLRDTVNCSSGYSSSAVSKCAKSGNGAAKITFNG